MKIRNHRPASGTSSASSGIKKSDGGSFRSLLDAGVADVGHSDKPGATAMPGGAGEHRDQADALMARAVEVLDAILKRIECEGAPDERDLSALQSLREELRGTLGKHLPEPVRRDADAMLAVESERMKHPW